MLPTYNHFNDLNKSYEVVGREIDLLKDFSMEDLQNSRSFFKIDSLIKRAPSPVDVDVFALLAGISFNESFLDYLNRILLNIKNLLTDELAYLVKRENLGVEYAVLKWPQDNLLDDLLKNCISFLEAQNLPKFMLHVYGMQVHKDGCLILKCIDQGMNILNLRKALRNEIAGLPNKQSNWCHIPLGRILNPIGANKMSKLKKLINECNENLNYLLEIDAIHLVNETRWYMEEKKYIYTKMLT